MQGTSIPDQFKQAWQEEIGDDEDEPIDDTGHVVISSTIAIQMITSVNGKTKIPYQNFLMNSAFAVRPLRMWKVKENRRITQKEATRLKDEVRNAVPLNLTPNISVKLHGLFSLMDSKVVTGRILIGIYVYDNKVIGIFYFQMF